MAEQDREKARLHRYYGSNILPTLRDQRLSEHERQLLLALYDQVHASWRQLVEVRFKLLGLVPAVSSGLLLFILTQENAPRWGKVLITLFGLLVTAGLILYDRRNTTLHDDLISRGRKIEEELGVDTGIFRGRKNASGIVKHDIAINLIYASCLFAWLAGAVLFLFVYP